MSAIPSPSQRAAFDTAYFRQALSQFATGVTVITATLPDGAPCGVTINSFNSVSLDPPLVLWSLAHTASTMAAFAGAGAGGYVINVLAGDQVDLAQRFAHRDERQFDALPYKLNARGVPVLGGTVAWFECRHRSRYTEGDHDIFVGEVEQCHFHPHRTLGFHRGRFIALS
jgi:flavin reductase (DIM6/NTAB) family NADH-FMN oxidoreductase RutF